MIAAMGRNRVIGHQGQLPWHEPEDLQHFKRITTGHAVIMGRKTWDALGRPLPKRRNIVITRQPGFAATGAEVVPDVATAIQLAAEHDPEPMIIGGGEIYRLALPLATRVYLTVVDAEPVGDAWFPELGPEWILAEQRDSGRLSFRDYHRS
jgi:dihydrofolate reductase